MYYWKMAVNNGIIEYNSKLLVNIDVTAVRHFRIIYYHLDGAEKRRVCINMLVDSIVCIQCEIYLQGVTNVTLKSMESGSTVILIHSRYLFFGESPQKNHEYLFLCFS